MNRVYKQLNGKANEHRVLTLTKMLYATINSGRCSLRRIGAETLPTGRQVPGITDLESRIKQAKRCGSPPGLDSKYSDYESFFLPHIKPLLTAMAKNGPLLLAIDGSEVGHNCMALMISVVWGKRALPVCWLVRTGKKGHMPERVHIDLQVVLLGDGEFDGCDLQTFCQSKGWKYALRTAKTSLITTSGGETFAIGELYPMSEHTCWLIEDIRFTKARYGPINCLVWHNPQHAEPI